MAFLTAWPDMEASVFDASTALMASEKLASLQCPVMVTAGDAAEVRATFANEADTPTSFLVRTRISQGFVTLVRQDSQVVRLGPRESVQLAWPIGADDAAYERLILARVFHTRSAAMPAREAACGILVLPTSGVRGGLVYALGLGTALACLGLGGAWWLAQRRPLGRREMRRARIVTGMTLILAASLATGMLGWWMASHLLQVLAALFLAVLVEQLAQA